VPPSRAASCKRISGDDPAISITPTLVSEAELRLRFAKGDYLNRATAGEFGCCLKRSGRADSRDEPPGTRSVVVSYVDEFRHRIFLVHFYLRPDGAVGASGLPDPKWLYENGVVYQSFKPRVAADR